MSYTNAIISSSDPVSKPSQQPLPPAPPKVVQSVSVTPATTATAVVSVTPVTGNVSTPAVIVMSKSTTALPLAQPKTQQEPVPHHPVAIVSPMVSSAPLPPQPQIKPQVVDASEYSLFNSFSKVVFNCIADC